MAKKTSAYIKYSPINLRVSKFYGLNTLISDIQKIPDGFSPDSLNWITGDEQDSIVLRRGIKRLGTTDNGAGKITGLGIGTKSDGSQVPFFSYGRKVKYYDVVTDDTVEVNSNLLPVAANGEEVSIAPYQNLAGNFVYITSPNSSTYKIPVANPANAVDQLTPDYKGILKFGQSRSILFNRKDSNGFTDKTGMYMSYIDKGDLASYTQVTGEAVGVLGSTHYTHTLTAITGKRTAIQVVVSATVAAGTETFLDNKDGVLTSNFGGTGTVNYATGAIDITFSNVTTGAVTCSYYWEDATSAGVLDFSFNTVSPVAGTGRYFSQFDGGGPLNAVFPLANVFYGFHSLKTWQTTIPTNDDRSATTTASNLPFRDKMGVSYPYSCFGGTDGIYYINNANINRPEVYRLQLYTGATSANIASPTLLSKQLNLSQYSFDICPIFEIGNFIVLSFQEVKNGVKNNFNSRTLFYNKKTGAWDLTDLAVTRWAEYEGTLIGGDQFLNNLYTFLSGFDDDGSTINNYWTSGYTNHGIEGQKKVRNLVVNGLIQTSQKIKVSIATDGGNFTEVFQINGDGSYVDTGKSIAVGAQTIGSKTVGGGATVYANPFQVEIPINTGRYEWIRVKFEAVDGGYAQINYYEYKTITQMTIRSMPPRQGSL